MVSKVRTLELFLHSDCKTVVDNFDADISFLDTKKMKFLL